MFGSTYAWRTGTRCTSATDGGKLKADKLRIKLITNILPAAEKKLRQARMNTEVRKGRLHSFRHHFCTECVERLIPEQTVMGWLGHQDSRMVKHYYHLKDEQSQAHMNRLDLTGSGPTTESGSREPEN